MQRGASRSRNAWLATCLLALVLVTGGLVLLVAGRGEAARPGGVPTPAELARGPIASPPGLQQPAGDAAEVAPLDQAFAREEARLAPARRSELSEPGEGAGLTGRVVEADGTPLADLRVALLELEADLLFDAGAIDGPGPTLEIEETRTDRAGRFVLQGARPPAFHALGIDLGGPRATLRIVEHALAHGRRTDVGDVVLAPSGILSGRVVDESGAPVAEARVRAAPLPPEILAFPAHDVRPGGAFAVGPLVGAGSQGMVIELPGWLGRQLDRLPIPTTTSAADGTFRLEGAALGSLVGAVDRPGHVGAFLPDLDLTDGALDVGDVVLARGRTIHGTVEDPWGDPVAGAEVLAGAETVPGIVAILQPCGRTDGEGRFTLTGVPPDGQVVAAARRAPHEPWATVVTEHHADVLLELGAHASLTVHVRDGSGAPLSGARVQVRPAVAEAPGMVGAGMLASLLPRPRSPATLFREVEPGRHVLASLGAGSYEVTARAVGLAPALERVAHGEEASEITLALSAGHDVELRVLDARSGAPVAGAQAALRSTGPGGFATLAAGVTDPEGCARLGPFSPPAPQTSDDWFPHETVVTVRHPLYADHVSSIPPDAKSLEVRLETGGTLEGRVHCDGAPPQEPCMLLLSSMGDERRGGVAEVFFLPRFALTDAAGAFRVAGLPPGAWQVELRERFLDRDPLGLGDSPGAPLAEALELTIHDGETRELVVDLTATCRGPTARLVGSVHVEGRALEGAEVEVWAGRTVRVATDAVGRFETPAFSVVDPQVQVEIRGEVALPGTSASHLVLYSRTLQLAPDQVHSIDLDVRPILLSARVLDARDGGPIPGASVSAESHGSGDSGSPSSTSATDGSGEVALLVLETGDYSVSADAEGFVGASARVTVSDREPPEPVTLRLQPSVPCAGRVQVSTPGASPFTYLQVRSTEAGFAEGALLAAPGHAFELEGLPAGTYEATVYLPDGPHEAGTFELGESGRTDLVLVPAAVPTPE